MILRAKEILQIAEGHFRAHDAYLTSCNFAKPHWAIHSSRVDLKTGKDKDGDGKGDGVHYHAKHPRVHVSDVPVFYLPRVSGTAGSGSDFYLKSISGGKTSRFGLFLLTEWGEDIRLGKDRRKWGEWTLHLDEFQDRGFGHGLEIDYREPTYHGEIFGYRIHDEGDEDQGRAPHSQAGAIPGPLPPPSVLARPLSDRR